MRRALLMTTLVACAPEADTPERDWGSAYRADPQGTLIQVRAIEDTPTRELVVLTIADANPGASSELCPLLERGPARSRCERFNRSPHLWTPTQRSPRRQSAAGSRSFPEGMLGTWDGTPADPGDCDLAPLDRTCLEGLAREAASRGDAQAAAATCLAFADTTPRQDCFFVSAESMAPGDDHYAAGARLCAGAGSFAGQCHGHLLAEMTTALKAHEPSTAAALVPRRAEQIAAFWGSDHAQFAQFAQDAWYAQAASQWLALTDPFPTEAVAAWPVRAQAHVRSAVGLRISAYEDPLDQARQIAAGAAVPPTRRLQIDPQHPALYSPTLSPPLQRLLLFDDQHTRPSHADPAVDLQLAALAAMAAGNPPRLDPVEAMAQANRGILSRAAAVMLDKVQAARRPAPRPSRGKQIPDGVPIRP